MSKSYSGEAKRVDIDSLARKELIKKAVSAIPTRDLKNIVQDEGRSVFQTALPVAQPQTDPVAVPLNPVKEGKIVSIRLSFPGLIVEKAKERQFLRELGDQIKVALAGFNSESMTSSVLVRKSDDDPAIAQIALPVSRAEQLRSVLDSATLLSFTPMLKFAKFDEQFFRTSNSDAVGSISYIAPEVLQRLGEMERLYLDIKDKKNIVESYHEIMKRTNPYELRMEALRQIENPPIPLPGLDAPEQPAPDPVFPWSGVEGVLSPTAKAPPDFPRDSSPVLDPNAPAKPVIRSVPPSASVVMAKHAMDSALQQLSVDGVQLSAASSEINRRIEEAAENSELARIAAAGLASPQVLEQLIQQNTLKREQQRQKDELRVLKAWEKDGLTSVERENNMLYMQRLFALATGDEDAVAALEANDRKIFRPEEMREQLALVEKDVLKATQKKLQNLSSRNSKIGITTYILRGSNLPQETDCFVRLRVVTSRGSVELESQTGTTNSGEWNEGMFFEINLATKNDPGSLLEIQLYQYNSMGYDNLLAKASVKLQSIKDTDGQIGVYMLDPVEASMNGIVASLSVRFDVEDHSTYKQGLQPTQNLMRERNVDFIMDQVEMVEEQRRRLERKINDMGDTNLNLGSAIIPEVSGPSWVPEIGKVNEGPSPAINIDRQPGVSTPVTAATASSAPLRSVEKPLPSYDGVYKELVELVQKGQLGTPLGRQSSYDFCYVGQSKTDYNKDPKFLDYLSLMSDIVVQFKSDIPIIVTGLTTLCLMMNSFPTDPSRKRQIGLVLYESVTRSLMLYDQDTILADQILSGLSLVVANLTSSQVSNSHLDFVLAMWERVREPIQVEQITQILCFSRTTYRRSDQVSIVLAVLERYRFNPTIVNRALIALVTIYNTFTPPIPQTAVVKTIQKSDFPTNGSDIELVVVASGMYADIPSIQTAAIDALSCIASISSQNTEKVENIAAPVVIDQSLDRNKTNLEVQLSVCKLLLKLADLRPKLLDLSESVGCLMSIISSTTSNENVLVGLAALRACYTNAVRECLYNVSDNSATQFVNAIEAKSSADATIGRESCLTIEALMGSPSVREPLIKAGVVSIPLRAIKQHATEYPRMVRIFLSSLHSVILVSSRSAYQFTRLDGVQLVMNLALFDKESSSDWRAFAVLADACCVEDTKGQFNPDDDIERIVSLIDKMGRAGTGDIETVLHGIRLIGEISFNSSFSTKDLFQKINDVTKIWFGGGQVAFPLQTVVWALLSRRLPQKNQSRSERMTSPNGRELSFTLNDLIVKDYNLWVTSQGGAETGANVSKLPKEEKQQQQSEKGLFDTLTEYLSSTSPNKEESEEASSKTKKSKK